MPMRIAKTELDLDPIARTLLDELTTSPQSNILALTGNLGAGKTALTKAIARMLGVTQTVTSPTFVIVQSYPIPHHDSFSILTHIDAYRIEDENELSVLGWENFSTDPKRLIVLEWPERIPNLIPSHALRVHIDIGSDNERTFTYGT
jgi:tRNA threonylcarbamoyladenosine biosynthesis protein TsaE